MVPLDVSTFSRPGMHKVSLLVAQKASGMNAQLHNYSQIERDAAHTPHSVGRYTFFMHRQPQDPTKKGLPPGVHNVTLKAD